MLYANIPCPRDGLYGQLQFHYCPESEKVFLICDECLSLWFDIEDLDNQLDYPYMDHDNPLWPSHIYHFPIQELGCYLSQTREATEEEIVMYGWGKYIRTQGED